MKNIRQFDKKNKIYIILIIILSLIIFSLFTFIIIKMIEKSHAEFKITSSSVIYDSDNNLIRTNKDSILRKKWNRKYYLEYDDETYSLGNSVTVYNEKNGNVNLFGTFYEIKEKGEVTKSSENTLLKSSSISKFYKISDRKYLIVDNTITSSDMVTSNYLLVNIESNGYAFYSNNTINLKTIEPTNIKTSTFSFDVNNETLTFYSNNEVIDLKKVLGSTNEYKESTKNDTNTSTTKENSSSNITNNTVKNLITDINKNNNIDIEKRTSIIGVTASQTQININYVVYDPLSEYIDVYVSVNGTKYSLNKNLNLLTVDSLIPNTNYKLEFIYTYTSDGQILQNEFDSVNITTKLLNPVIKIVNILQNDKNSEIHYKIDNDVSNLEYEVALYDSNGILLDSNKESESTLNFSGEYGTYNIKLENIYLNNNKINEDISFKFSY